LFDHCGLSGKLSVKKRQPELQAVGQEEQEKNKATRGPTFRTLQKFIQNKNYYE
jgi:hypothetical protein